MIKLLESMGLTLLVAIVVAGFQSILKLVSRWKGLTQQGEEKEKLWELEDNLFWHEWIVTALVVMIIFVVSKSAQGNLSPAPLIVGVVLLVVGLLPVPVGIGALLCDGSGRIANGKAAIIADVVGLVFLMTVVAAGGRIYG